jgi:hypothetical protein
LAASRTAGHKRDTSGTMLFNDLTQLVPDFSKRLIPSDGFQPAILSLKRLLKALAVMLVIRYF